MSTSSTLRRHRRALIRTGLVAAFLSGPALVLSGGTAAQAAPSAPDRLVKVPSDQQAAGRMKVDLPLRSAKGKVDVSVTLSQAPVAEVVAEDALTTGDLPSPADQRARTAAVQAQQATLTAQARSLGATVTGRATRAGNVVTLRLDASKVDDVAALPGVVSVKRVARYRTTASPAAVAGSLAEAAEYLKVSGLRAQGLDGRGIRVAVLDSGIDFTHRNLGGPGTTAAYTQCHDGGAAAAAPVGVCATLFGPSAPKVKGGYDFVGETWDGDVDPVEDPDPNPIDFEGHGTHVADIITGRSADGSHAGLAPGADLYAVKVCSAKSSLCSGVALLQGVDFVLDPNRDGDISDALDLMNLSLGSDYGQPEDDLTFAVNNAIRAGVVGVISAGNGGDKPFIVGSPSTASRAISVAQTSLPQDKIYPITVESPQVPALPGNQIRNSVLQTWSPAPTAAVTGPLARPKVITGCDPSDFAGFPKGAVALISRGICAVSIKGANASAAGASSAIVYNNRPDGVPSFSYGGGDVTVPTYSVSQASGQALVGALGTGAVVVTIDPADAVLLPNTMVGTSSRGPRIADARVKPDLGAPGAWLSAEVQTGSEETNFGGTSGAAPTVSGVAVLVLQKYPRATPATVKARLISGAAAGNTTLDDEANPYLTPVSRVGAGEVRADTAVGSTTVLANTSQANGNLGWGMPRLTAPWSQTTTVELRNTSGSRRTYTLDSSFRDGADAASGAVSVTVPRTVSVPARSEASVRVTVRVDPSKLESWPFTYVASSTTAGTDLNGPEFDGWVTATSGGESARLGWHVLPRKASDVSAPSSARVGSGTTLPLTNASAVEVGQTEVYALTGTSPKQPRPAPGEPGSPGSNVPQVDLAAVGVADIAEADVLAFAVADHRRTRTPLYPKLFEVDIDVNRDGTPEWAIVNLELNGFGVSGLSAAYVVDLTTFEGTPYYLTQADFDASTMVLAAPLSVLGLKAGDTFDFAVYGADGYNTNTLTDAIEGMTWTVGGAKYATPGGVVTPESGTAGVRVVPTGASGESTQSGLLLLHGSNADQDFETVRLR